MTKRVVKVAMVVGALLAGGFTYAMKDDGNNPKPCDSDICLPGNDPDSPLPGPGGGESGEGVPTGIPEEDVPSTVPPAPPPQYEDEPGYPWESDDYDWDDEDPGPWSPDDNDSGGDGPIGGGGGGGGGNQNPPPETDGDGGDGEDCVETAKPGTSSAAAGTKETCKPGQTCSKCGPKKKKACLACKADFDEDIKAVTLEYNLCKSKAKTEASTHCHLGEVPGGAVNGAFSVLNGSAFPSTSVVLVGNNWEEAQECYEENGFKWVKSCPTAFIEVYCPILWGDCQKTKGWRDCINGWVAGNEDFFGQFGIQAGASWEVPIVGIKVNVGGDLAGKVDWAPTEGTLALCGKKAAKAAEKFEATSDACKKKVNTDFKGGEKCAY